MKSVKEVLEIAGYSDERIVDISVIIQMYEECGYRYSDMQKSFVERYGFLEIHYNHPVWNTDMIIRINPLEAQKVITRDVVEEYNEFLEDDLLIIGDIDKENMTLFLSEQGYFFGGYDDCIINWGNDFNKMLFDLLTGNKGILKIID